MFAVVDGLTRLSANLKNAADRAEADEESGRLQVLTAYPPAKRFQEEGLNAPPALFPDPAPAFQSANPFSRGLTAAKDRGQRPGLRARTGRFREVCQRARQAPRNVRRSGDMLRRATARRHLGPLNTRSPMT